MGILKSDRMEFINPPPISGTRKLLIICTFFYVSPHPLLGLPPPLCTGSTAGSSCDHFDWLVPTISF